MNNRKTITREQEKQTRDQAFYLLKKYTSFTFLDQTRLRYQGFLDAFVNQLKNPSLALQNDPDADFYQTRHEYEYKEFLRQMMLMEQGLALLLSTRHKQEAYSAMCRTDFIDRLFGRYADEKGV